MGLAEGKYQRLRRGLILGGLWLGANVLIYKTLEDMIYDKGDRFQVLSRVPFLPWREVFESARPLKELRYWYAHEQAYENQLRPWLMDQRRQAGAED